MGARSPSDQAAAAKRQVGSKTNLGPQDDKLRLTQIKTNSQLVLSLRVKAQTRELVRKAESAAHLGGRGSPERRRRPALEEGAARGVPRPHPRRVQEDRQHWRGPRARGRGRWQCGGGRRRGGRAQSRGASARGTGEGTASLYAGPPVQARGGRSAGDTRSAGGGRPLGNAGAGRARSSLTHPAPGLGALEVLRLGRPPPSPGSWGSGGAGQAHGGLDSSGRAPAPTSPTFPEMLTGSARTQTPRARPAGNATLTGWSR